MTTVLEEKGNGKRKQISRQFSPITTEKNMERYDL